MVELHHFLGWVVAAVTFVAGCWALASNWVSGLAGRPMWLFVGFSQVLVVVQVTLGAWLLGAAGRTVNDLHAFYGFVAFASVAIIYSYRHSVKDPRLLYGVGGLWLMGLALRTITLV